MGGPARRDRLDRVRARRRPATPVAARRAGGRARRRPHGVTLPRLARVTREQERARARRRAEKFEAKQALKEREAARNRQVAVVVAAVLVVVAAFVFLTTQLGDDTTTPAAAPTTSSTSSTTTSPVEGCTAAPAPPSAITKVAKPDQATAAGKTFTAVVTTNCGDITLELDGAKAPQTVASFVSLAKANYFAASPCHRVTTEGIFVLQCGDPLGG